jgi:hypothetical protein
VLRLMHDLKVSRRLNSMKSSRAISCVRCLYDEDRDDLRNVGFIQTHGAADSPRRLHRITGRCKSGMNIWGRVATG